MSTREEQREKRRGQILSAGLSLFIRKGYAATRISDIAERVGMSTGLLFHYFPSKEKLYEELIAIGVNTPMAVMAPTEMEPLAFFVHTTEEILFYIRSQPFTAEMFVLMAQAYCYEAAVPPSIRDTLRHFDVYTPTAALLQKGQESGTIRSGDPYALAIAYWCAIQGIAEQIALWPQTPCPESEWIVDIIRRKDT